MVRGVPESFMAKGGLLMCLQTGLIDALSDSLLSATYERQDIEQWLYRYNESIVEGLKDSTAVRKRPLDTPYISIVDSAQTLSSANSTPCGNVSLNRNFALIHLEGLQSKLQFHPDNQVF